MSLDRALLVEHVFEVLRSYAKLPGVHVEDAGTFLRCNSGIAFNAANMVLIAVDGHNAVSAAVDEAGAPLVAVPLPFLLWGLPPTHADSLATATAALGYRPAAVLPAMTAATAEIDDRPLPAGVAVQRVEDETTFQQWVDTFVAVYRWGPEPMSLFTRLFASARQSDFAEWEFYLATLDGRPVGVTSNYFGTQLAGLWNEGTVADARRRGVGTALVQFAARRAQALGYANSVLVASAEGRPLYEKLSYRARFEIPIYLKE